MSRCDERLKVWGLLWIDKARQKLFYFCLLTKVVVKSSVCKLFFPCAPFFFQCRVQPFFFLLYFCSPKKCTSPNVHSLIAGDAGDRDPGSCASVRRRRSRAHIDRPRSAQLPANGVRLRSCLCMKLSCRLFCRFVFGFPASITRSTAYLFSLPHHVPDTT
jgi:hypothetical protein